LQAAYQYLRIIRENSAIVSSQISDKGAVLARMLKGFKHISVTPSDPTIVLGLFADRTTGQTARSDSAADPTIRLIR
jgi:hypothetical protein